MSQTPDLQHVHIDYQPIELCKLLKIANLVSGGGEAKILISEGYVILNNEVELQKRKKVYAGDIVEFNGEVIQVICDNAEIPLKTEKSKKGKVKKVTNSSIHAKKSKNKTEKVIDEQDELQLNDQQPVVRTRKPISF